jgi:mRNA degradation ribonuclease J1/J2
LIRERDILGETGVCSVALAYDEQLGTIIGQPRVIAHAVASDDALDEMLPGATDVVLGAMRGISGGTAASTVERAVEKALSDFFFREARNRPEVIVHALPM